jgi:hypothetical protein
MTVMIPIRAHATVVVVTLAIMGMPLTLLFEHPSRPSGFFSH